MFGSLLLLSFENQTPIEIGRGAHCLEACCFGFLKIRRRPRQAKHDSVPTLRFREVLRPAHCLDTCCLQVLKHHNRPPKRTNAILSFSSHPRTPKTKVLRWKLGHHTALKQLVQTMAIQLGSPTLMLTTMQFHNALYVQRMFSMTYWQTCLPHGSKATGCSDSFCALSPFLYLRLPSNSTCHVAPVLTEPAPYRTTTEQLQNNYRTTYRTTTEQLIKTMVSRSGGTEIK